MRRINARTWLVLAAFCFMGTSIAFAAETSTLTVTADITQAGLTVTNTTMDFGTIISAGADTVIIDASGGPGATPSPTTAAMTNVTGGGAGSITVTSTVPNAVVTITYPTSITVSDGAATPSTMTVNQIDTYSTASPLTLTGTTGDIDVGGRLVISDSQTTGTYTGTGTITIDYQ